LGVTHRLQSSRNASELFLCIDQRTLRNHLTINHFHLPANIQIFVFEHLNLVEQYCQVDSQTYTSEDCDSAPDTPPALNRQALGEIRLTQINTAAAVIKLPEINQHRFNNLRFEGGRQQFLQLSQLFRTGRAQGNLRQIVHSILCGQQHFQRNTCARQVNAEPLLECMTHHHHAFTQL